jgi:hypothetical protein
MKREKLKVPLDNRPPHLRPGYRHMSKPRFKNNYAQGSIADRINQMESLTDIAVAMAQVAKIEGMSTKTRKKIEKVAEQRIAKLRERHAASFGYL